MSKSAMAPSKHSPHLEQKEGELDGEEVETPLGWTLGSDDGLLLGPIDASANANGVSLGTGDGRLVGEIDGTNDTVSLRVG